MKESFICADSKDLFIQGNQNTASGSELYIDIVKCTPREGLECKSDEEIKEYFSFFSINLLKNQVRFDQQFYGEESIIQESRIDWHNVGNWGTRVQYLVTKTEVFLQDIMVNLDELTELEDATVFEVTQKGFLY